MGTWRTDDFINPRLQPLVNAQRRCQALAISEMAYDGKSFSIINKMDNFG